MAAAEINSQGLQLTQKSGGLSAAAQ